MENRPYTAAILKLLALLCGMLPLAAEEPLYTLDLRPLNRLDLGRRENAEQVWDTVHVAAALQGLANRSQPQLYLFYCSEFGVDTDQFWFDWFRNEDGWLRGRETQALAGLEEALKQFRAGFDGLVVYDPKVPATANLASTAAGCEKLLPVRFDPRTNSVHHLLVERMKLPVKLRLVGEDGASMFTGRGRIPGLDEVSTGSAKADCYVWAMHRWLRASGCAPGIAAYYIDSFWIEHPRRGGPTLHTLSNHDYFIGRRAFFFDVSPWGEETPNDDPKQALGTDRRVFLCVLKGLYERADGGVIQLGGFPPWPYKYTSHSAPPGKYEGVPTEWEFSRLISQFNGYMEADAAGLGAIANASFYQHYPLKQRYAQPNRKPAAKQWREAGYLRADGSVAPRLYVGHYVGDYDSPSWLYKAVPAFFPDSHRGKVPLGWAFNPNLARRAPQALAYAYAKATTNDFFIAGDSGAGYLNPRSLTVRPDSGLPSGLEAWTRHCREDFRRWDMSITGFILDGSGGGSTELEFRAYRTFSPDGAGTHFEPGPAMHAGLATCPERDLPDEAEKAAEVIAGLAREVKGKPRFLWARSILKPPKWYAQVSELLEKRFPGGEVVVVDPYTFFGLIKEQTR